MDHDPAWKTVQRYFCQIAQPTTLLHYTVYTLNYCDQNRTGDGQLSSPDLQLSSTTCCISPPKKGTLTSSSCSKLRAEAKPVTSGTYFKELVGPAQFLMTNVRRFTHKKSLNGWGFVRRTHFRYKCLSMDTQGISGTLTPEELNYFRHL